MSVRQNGKIIAGNTATGVNLLDCKWSDHILNDISWLRADTFSWQSGDVYVAAYNHLIGDLETVSKNFLAWANGSKTRYTLDEKPGSTVYALNTLGDMYEDNESVFDGSSVVDDRTGDVYTRDASQDTVSKILFSATTGDTTISYYLAEDGHKICMPDQESNVSEMYETTGAADYYILDTTNKQFKLPRNYQSKRTLVRTANNTYGMWYKLYSDGWVEQGGYDSTNFNNRSWTYPIAMSDRNYTLTLSVGYVNIDTQNGKFGVTSRTETGFSYKVIYLGGNAVGDNMSWRVEGYSAVQVSGFQRKYEYYYVGNFEQSAIEQTAGLNAELFNGKADSDLKNIPTNYDYVVESQLPTSANGYTWYRKYKSGWVEQGGNAKHGTVALPITMSGANYTVVATANVNDGYIVTSANKTATGFNLRLQLHNGTIGSNIYADWQVSGMAAQ